VQTAFQLVKTDSAAVKAGYKTSEFWLHLAYQVAVWVTTLNLNTKDQQVAGVVASVVGLLGYTASRTVVKSNS
jgi:hypothetical protein